MPHHRRGVERNLPACHLGSPCADSKFHHQVPALGVHHAAGAIPMDVYAQGLTYGAERYQRAALLKNGRDVKDKGTAV
ncbi:hypothetical protein kuro4_03990 [Gelria sp. Kuro-4]|nr:hypothetical protein kuro4_03990 [Gelria sp. Kuro-4]